MKWFGVVASAVVVIALGFGVAKATGSSSPAPLLAPCNATALAAPYHGTDKIDSVDSFGCVGHWAYMWATIGTGVHEIGVTDVLSYDQTASSWKNVSRLTYCNHNRLPHYVEFWGCNSN
ncbi:MAG TPA: hypothetical protein VIJ40_00135 [Acidimicrobiales bacterium]